MVEVFRGKVQCKQTAPCMAPPTWRAQYGAGPGGYAGGLGRAGGTEGVKWTDERCSGR